MSGGSDVVVPSTMVAARAVEFEKPLEISADVPVPEPGHGQVLVKLCMTGVCHTDVHVRDGDLSAKPALPIIPGHEGVGKVFKLGPGTSLFSVGDRVCCPCMCGACGNCEHCCGGNETACERAVLAGMYVNGTFAQFYLAQETFLCRIPDKVSDEEAAPINCAGVTTYKALKVSEARAGQWVAVVGAAGGLGYYAVQYGKAMGLNVIAVDRGEDKMKYLQETFGVTTLDSGLGDVTAKIHQLTGEGAHAVINLVPNAGVIEEAMTYLRKRGTLVMVGLPPSKVSFDPVVAILRLITVRGSLVGTRLDMMEALKLVADGHIKSAPRIREFSEVNAILNELASGTSTGRNVIKIPE